MLSADEYIQGDPLDQANIFHWDFIDLNLPGSACYIPYRSWVTKRQSSGALTRDFLFYVGDSQTTGNDLAEMRAATHRVASMLKFLWLQDAPRKRRDASQTTDAQAGSIICTLGDTATLNVSQERWHKAKGMPAWIHQHYNPFQALGESSWIFDLPCLHLFSNRSTPQRYLFNSGFMAAMVTR
jgi:hypothetical protein